jgi:RNA recognition motif-containing protein
MSPIAGQTRKTQILEWFGEFGAIDCQIREKDGNRFAFVTFATESDRDRAIEAKRNCLFQGQQVVVNRSFNAFRGPRLGGRMRYDELEDRFINY